MKKCIWLAFIWVVVWRQCKGVDATWYRSEGWNKNVCTTNWREFDTFEDAKQFMLSCPDKSIDFRVIQFKS